MNDREKKTIANMITIYCNDKHGSTRTICKECNELLEYATIRLEKCRFGNKKPTCSSCSIHCYSPIRQQQVKEVMRYAGPRMIYRHPIDALLHLYKNIFIKNIKR